MKRKRSVGYFSSYDRGLECLLDMWPEIVKQVPDATLDIYYGWDMFDQFHRKDPVKMKWKWQMMKKMHDVGAEEHGRVDHETLARVMKHTQVWAYPTEFTEIHCITALKAQEAGMIPVVTDVAALQETVVRGYRVGADDIYSNKKAQKTFIDLVVRAMQEGDESDEDVPNRYWPDVAKVWDKELS